MKTINSYTCVIWIAGDFNDAVRMLRSFCEEGACFAVERCAYVYTGGMEDGVKVTRINYPRFPASREQIKAQTIRLAHFLREGLFQDSFAVETPEETIWFSRREGTQP
jgi:hypothetical protein